MNMSRNIQAESSGLTVHQVGKQVAASYKSGLEDGRRNALVDLTEAEMEAVDRFMSDHMYGHQISNNINGMSCHVQCRIEALGEAFRRHGLMPRRTPTDQEPGEPT